MARLIGASKGFQFRLGGMSLLLALPILVVGAILLVLFASFLLLLVAGVAVVGTGVYLWLKLTGRFRRSAMPSPTVRTVDVVDIEDVRVIDVPAPKQLNP
jgi:hypothetical protein